MSCLIVGAVRALSAWIFVQMCRNQSTKVINPILKHCAFEAILYLALMYALKPELKGKLHGEHDVDSSPHGYCWSGFRVGGCAGLPAW